MALTDLSGSEGEPDYTDPVEAVLAGHMNDFSPEATSSQAWAAAHVTARAVDDAAGTRRRAPFMGLRTRLLGLSAVARKRARRLAGGGSVASEMTPYEQLQANLHDFDAEGVGGRVAEALKAGGEGATAVPHDVRLH